MAISVSGGSNNMVVQIEPVGAMKRVVSNVRWLKWLWCGKTEVHMGIVKQRYRP
jgi:hypothetical protein